MPTHNTKGTIATTQLSNPTTPVGKYASDGSWNIVTNAGSGPFIGLHHPSGALNAVICTDRIGKGYYAPNGSINVIANTQGGVSPLYPAELV